MTALVDTGAPGGFTRFRYRIFIEESIELMTHRLLKSIHNTSLR
jgi:hypothetical protein